jgi:hypothetical protein
MSFLKNTVVYCQQDDEKKKLISKRRPHLTPVCYLGQAPSFSKIHSKPRQKFQRGIISNGVKITPV